MQFPDDLTGQFSPCSFKKFQMQNLIKLMIYNMIYFWEKHTFSVGKELKVMIQYIQLPVHLLYYIARNW